eukprot:4072313-Pyramimonas_sp.AAC.1
MAHNVPLYVDCAATVGCLRNLAGAASASSALAHWWAETGDRLEGIQVFCFLFIHITASHTSTVDVREGRITDLHGFGNSEADRLAKEGP